MFTIEQIKEAHNKVRSGADFPRFIQDLKKLGVIHYESYVNDGHTDYYGNNEFKISGPGKYNSLVISEEWDTERFKARLRAHQQGKTDYLTFCNDCASSGVVKWIVSLHEMTCTYFNKAGNAIFSEKIPE